MLPKGLMEGNLSGTAKGEEAQGELYDREEYGQEYGRQCHVGNDDLIEKTRSRLGSLTLTPIGRQGKLEGRRRDQESRGHQGSRECQRDTTR